MRAVSEHLQEVRIAESVTVADLSFTDIVEHIRDNNNMDSNNNDSNMMLTVWLDDVTQSANTQHATVGKVFSNSVYDIPYTSVADLESFVGAKLRVHEFDNVPPCAMMSEMNSSTSTTTGSSTTDTITNNNEK